MKRLLLCLALAGSLAGCARGFDIATPDGFAELEEQDRYDYRATNAAGVVLAVRRKANEPAGDLSFWSGALDAHLRRQGYRAVEAKPVESDEGIRGRQLHYERSHAGRTHTYWVTVFVTDAEVITVETGGDEAYFAEEKDSVQKAIRSLKLS